MKNMPCRIDYSEGKHVTIRLPAKDICRLHMQLELLKKGELKELTLQPEIGDKVNVGLSLIGLDLLDRILEMLERGFMAYGDISWMHLDDEICIDGHIIDISVGFFY